MTLYIRPSSHFHFTPTLLSVSSFIVRGLGRGQDYIIVLGRVWVRVTPCKLVCRIPESAWRGGRALGFGGIGHVRSLSLSHSQPRLTCSAPLYSTLRLYCCVVSVAPPRFLRTNRIQPIFCQPWSVSSHGCDLFSMISLQ